MNSRTWPKRCVSQPVSGTEIALATANEVMTQVPWVGLTPRSPAIAGIDTLAIERVEHVHEGRQRQRDRAQHERAPVQRRGRGGAAALAARPECVAAMPRGGSASRAGGRPVRAAGRRTRRRPPPGRVGGACSGRPRLAAMMRLHLGVGLLV